MSKLFRLPRVVAYRIYQDFFMPSRIGEYSRMLSELSGAGYSFLGVGDYAKLISENRELPRRTVVLRHDVDTDPETARRMFDVEKQLNIRSTYFFRLSTLNHDLMADMNSFGTEVSYHYEEIATVAKRHSLRSRQHVMARMTEIQELFAKNISKLRDRTGLPMTTVASHGDFANRALGVPNHELLTPALRTALGIAFEVYDRELQMDLSARLVDRPPPTWWHPEAPLEAVASSKSPIYILVHPKQWHADIAENSRELLLRLKEGYSFSMRSR